MVSVLIPIYNEEKSIKDCLKSLTVQTYKNMEIILVDDGSNDNSKVKIQESKILFNIKNLKILKQSHQGPGAARNLGSKHAKGDIFVFVDADMTFDKNFIKELVAPIEEGRSTGTFSKEEYLLNKNSEIAVCWNINRYFLNKWKLDSQVFTRILPREYPDKQEVFRAIKKSEFMKVGGFDSIGYTDDWTLSKKLDVKASVVSGGIFYHRNPENPGEMMKQAQWIGRNVYISGNSIRKIYNLIRYSIPVSFFWGFIISLYYRRLNFFLFKLLYDIAISSAIIKSFFSVNNNYKTS